MKKIVDINRMLVTFLAGAAAMAATAGEVTVTLPEVAGALENARPGDVINIADGNWNDVRLNWRAPGFPMTVRALRSGRVRVGGNSSLRLSGDSLTVEGLDFRGVTPAKGSGVVEFRDGKEVANACRLTDCLIDSCNPSRRDITASYIVLHGRGNRVDHCSLTGKLNLGVTLLVNLNDARSLDNNHLIDHNYFGPRPVYGSNGAETMRIGTSQQAYESSRTRVENNLFDRCDGEVEVISVKSSDNVVKGNTFLECEGVVALRHGKRNRVEGNLFLGNGRRNTGGVRVVDSGHIIERNTFDGLAGGRFFSALALMNSVPNSLPNRYVRVSDATVSDNTFANCSNIEFGTGRDMERTEAPAACSFTGNRVYTDDTSNPYRYIDPATEVAMKGNKVLPLSKYKAPKTDLAAVRRGVGANRPAEVAASATAPDTIRLPKGIVDRAEPYIISRPTVIVGDSTTLRWTGSKSGNFITIADGGELAVSGVTFDFALQQGHAVARNAIATTTDMIAPYRLTVADCAFINSPESGCCAIRGTKGTFAEEITVSRCRFADLSGNGISLADETDDKGRYSADDITIEDCAFDHMLGIPVNIYRGGSDESTAGPYVAVTGCVFTDCCNKERGSVLRLIGPQKLLVADCRFIHSGRGGATVRLDETTWEDVKVARCSWTDSGRVISNRDVIE